MPAETIVAVYATPREADAAIHALKVKGVQPGAITLHAQSELAQGVPPPPEQHFIPRMFGYEPDEQAERDQLVYERALRGGASVVVVHGVQNPEINVMGILGKHHPVDVHEEDGDAVRRYVVS